MGHSTVGLKDVVYFVMDENGQPIGQAHKVDSIEASVLYDDIIESKKDHEPFYTSFSGELTIDIPRKNGKAYDWFKYLHYHHYTEKITFMLGHLFKDVRIMDNVALWHMAEGLYKLDQVRKQKSSVRRDSFRQYRGKEFLSVFKG